MSAFDPKRTSRGHRATQAGNLRNIPSGKTNTFVRQLRWRAWAVQAQSLMIATKRFNRHGLLISALGHFGILDVALVFARAASQEAVPPDAMQVEIITPKEMPRYSGTPSTLRTSGTEQAAQSQALTEKSEQPPTIPPPPQPKDQH